MLVAVPTSSFISLSLQLCTLCAPHTHCLLRSSYFTSFAPASTIPSFLLLLLFTHTHDPLLPRPFSTPEVLILTFRFPFQSRSSSEQPFLPSHCLSLSNLLICISPSLSWQPSSCPHTLLALESGMALCASLPHTADSRPLPNSRLSSKCNEFATRFRIRFAAVSRLSRAVSRLVSRVSHRVFREFRGCLAAVSRCFTGVRGLMICALPAIHPPAKFVTGSKPSEIWICSSPQHL